MLSLGTGGAVPLTVPVQVAFTLQALIVTPFGLERSNLLTYVAE
jgi:hypothetical protein